MSHHSIIELSHDHAHKWNNPGFGNDLHALLAKRWPEKISNKLLQKYGIKILSQHHSSQRHELTVADKGEEYYTEAEYIKRFFSRTKTTTDG